MARADLRSVSLIGVDVHLEGVAGLHSDQDISKDKVSAITIDRDFYDVSIVHTKSLGVLWGHVNMTPRADEALFEGESTRGANQGNTGRIREVPRVSHRRVYAQFKLVRPCNLDLTFGPSWTQHADALNAGAWPDDCAFLFAGELSRLG